MTPADDTPLIQNWSVDTDIDTAASDAQIVLDTAAGSLSTPGMFAMASTGTGVLGAVTYSTDVLLPGGTYEYASLTIDPSIRIDVSGDSTWLIQGDFSHQGGIWLAEGVSLTVVSGGAFSLNSGFFEARNGDLNLQATSTQGMTWVNGSFVASDRVDPSLTSGSLSVWTRGGIDFDHAFFSLEGMTQSTGSIEVHAYGDITASEKTGTTSFFSILDANGGSSGQLLFWTEGSMNFQDRTELIADGDLGGGSVDFRTGGDLVLDTGSYIISTAGVVAQAEGQLRLENRAQIISQCSGRTADLVLTGSQIVIATDSSVASSKVDGISGTRTYLHAVGDVILDGGGDSATVYGSPGVCDAGGSIEVRAGGNLLVREGGLFAGGSNWAGTGSSETCTTRLARGGDVDIEVGGVVTQEPGAGHSIVQGGLGMPDGTVTQVEGSDPGLGSLIESGVTLWPSVTSILQDEKAQLNAVTLGALTGQARLLIDVDGTDNWVSADTLIGQPLPAGWRYRMAVKQRQFDGSQIAGFELTFVQP